MFNLTFYILVKFSFILLYFFQNLIENLITRFKNNVNQYTNIGCAWDAYLPTRGSKTKVHMYVYATIGSKQTRLN
jgi:hypothetical protein